MMKEKDAYQMMNELEENVVEGFNKVTDKAVEKLFKKDGETVEEAKERLSAKIK